MVTTMRALLITRGYWAEVSRITALHWGSSLFTAGSLTRTADLGRGHFGSRQHRVAALYLVSEIQVD